MKQLQNALLLTALIVFNIQLVFAQGWEKDLPSLGRYIHQLEDGTFIISKGSFSTGLIKANADGNILWHSSFNYEADNYYDNFTNLNFTPTSDGHYLMVGRRRLTDTDSPMYATKLDSAGNVIWAQHYITAPAVGIDNAVDVLEVENGNFLILGSNDFDAASSVLESEIILIKIDAQGNQIWKKQYNLGADYYMSAGSIIKHPESGFIILGFVYGHPEGIFRLFGIDDEGNETWGSFIGTPENSNSSPTNFGKLIATNDGGYAIAAREGNSNNREITLTKVDAQGIELWHKTIISAHRDNFVADLEIHPDSGFLLSGQQGAGSLGGQDAFFVKTDANGEIEWKRNYGGPFDDHAFSFVQLEEGGYVLCGRKSAVSNSGGQVWRGYILKVDSLGYLFRNKIQGNVFEDLDLDCADIPEAGLQDWFVELNGTQQYFDVTDSLGNYCIPVDTGDYELTIHPISPYWQPCQETQDITINSSDTLTVNLPVQTEVECPYLLVDISTPFLRRCFENNYTVRYCNAGTTPAEDAYIEVELDESLIFNSSTIPLVSQDSNLYRFDIGHVEVGECDRFKINVTVDCDSTDLGQTHCVQANIYPDSLCLPTPNWSGASVELDASCTGDSVIFTLKNVGTAPTTPNLDYLVIEDEVILFQEQFTLAVDESITVSVPASGTTFRMEAEQEPNHPGDDDPSVTVEGCGGEQGIVSFGFVNQFFENDGNPFVSIDCQENVGSWDPNDKRAFPKGYSEDHFIEANTAIEYHIRFQNTGTDTAFSIVVRDVLSDNLDLTSVRPGTSSHPYEFSVGPNRTLEFTFNNIMLPDSNVNEVASHGFIKFKVSQVPDLEDGQRIFNGAAIYFDFNEPIFTNATYHTIGSQFILTKVIEHSRSARPAKVFPNPFKEQATFEISEIAATQELQFYLMDLQGRLIQKHQFRGNTFEFHRNGLPGGVYFYRIEMEGSIINAGKIITQ